MINFESFVISVPARDLGGLHLTGSVIDANELKKMKLAPDLQMAIDLMTANYSPKRLTLQCIVRPEIFTNDRSMHWLQQKLIGVTDHLYLSDGATLKLLPKLRNHLFLYGLQQNQRMIDFQRLLRRAPEILHEYKTQINSFHQLKVSGLMVGPEPLAIMPPTSSPGKILCFYAFYFNPHSIEESTCRMLSWGEFKEGRLDEFDAVTYLPLTEIGLSDFGLQRLLSDLITKAYFNTKSCVLIRLPSPAAELELRMQLSIQGIRNADLQVPRARASNIFFLADDPSEKSLLELGSRLSLVLHHSYEFWRYTKASYQAAKKILYIPPEVQGGKPKIAEKLITQALGRSPVLHMSHELADIGFLTSQPND